MTLCACATSLADNEVRARLAGPAFLVYYGPAFLQRRLMTARIARPCAVQRGIRYGLDGREASRKLGSFTAACGVELCCTWQRMVVLL